MDPTSGVLYKIRQLDAANHCGKVRYPTRECYYRSEDGPHCTDSLCSSLHAYETVDVDVCEKNARWLDAVLETDHFICYLYCLNPRRCFRHHCNISVSVCLLSLLYSKLSLISLFFPSDLRKTTGRSASHLSPTASTKAALYSPLA